MAAKEKLEIIYKLIEQGKELNEAIKNVLEVMENENK